MTTPTIILVPGFWLGAWAWDEVAGLLHTDGFMGPQVIHHHEIAGPQRWAQHAFDIGPEDVRVRRACHGHDRLKALDAKGA